MAFAQITLLVAQATKCPTDLFKSLWLDLGIRIFYFFFPRCCPDVLRAPVKAWSLWLWFRDALSAHHSSHCHIQHFAEGWGDPKPSLWGWFPAAPGVCCSLGDISSLPLPFSWNLSSPKVPHKLLTYGCAKLQPYPFWKLLSWLYKQIWENHWQ